MFRKLKESTEIIIPKFRMLVGLVGSEGDVIRYGISIGWCFCYLSWVFIVSFLVLCYILKIALQIN